MVTALTASDGNTMINIMTPVYLAVYLDLDYHK